MQYKVKQVARGSEMLLAEFTNVTNAKLFIQARLQEDVGQKFNATYRLIEFDDVIEEFDQTKISSSHRDTDAQGSQGKQSGSNFRPTPLATAPRPPGTPAKWWKDDEEKNK